MEKPRLSKGGQKLAWASQGLYHGGTVGWMGRLLLKPRHSRGSHGQPKA